MSTIEQPSQNGVAYELELGQVAKGAGIALAGRIVGNGLRYLSYLVIARLLGVESFGLYVLGFIVYQFAELCAGLGLQSGVVRYVSIHYSAKDTRGLKGVLLDALRLPLLGGAGLAAVLYLISPMLAQGVFGEPRLVGVLQIFALGLPLGTAVTVLAFATTGFQVTRYLVYSKEFFQPLAYLVFIIILFLLGFKLLGVVSAWALASALTLILVLYYLKELLPAVTEKNKNNALCYNRQELLKFSAPLLFVSLVGFSQLWMDTIMLGYFRTASEVGIYRAAAQTALTLTIFLASLETIFSPKIADLYHGKDLKKLDQLFKATTRWSLSLTLPCFLILVLAGEEALRLFGPQFPAGWLPLVILGGGQLINAATGSVGFMLIMCGRQYQHLWGDLVMLVLNITLNALLIPRWGLLGAALATGISIAGVNLMRLVQVYALLGFQPYERNYIKTVAAGVVAGLGAWALKYGMSGLDLHFLLSLGITVLVLSSLYLLTLWVLGFSKEDRSVWEALKRR